MLDARVIQSHGKQSLLRIIYNTRPFHRGNSNYYFK